MASLGCNYQKPPLFLPIQTRPSSLLLKKNADSLPPPFLRASAPSSPFLHFSSHPHSHSSYFTQKASSFQFISLFSPLSREFESDPCGCVCVRRVSSLSGGGGRFPAKGVVVKVGDSFSSSFGDFFMFQLHFSFSFPSSCSSSVTTRVFFWRLWWRPAAVGTLPFSFELCKLFLSFLALIFAQRFLF